ncbi:hypothetical protein [Xanthomonas hortorum]|uniref:hypothetical protein n=1 Tax=Xanthomonas hortorum TaxID=56454 RepID=UPI0032E8D3F5
MISRLPTPPEFAAVAAWARRRGWLVAAACVAIGLLAWLGVAIDSSRALSQAELASLRQFAEQTGVPAVETRLKEAERNGSVSLREAQAVIEVAKAYGPEYGLASDAP